MTPTTANRPRGPVRRGERGQAAIEFIGWVPIVLLVFLFCVEMFTYFYVAEQATSAARAGARISGQGGDGYAAARRALAPGIRAGAQVHAGGGQATVTAKVPVLPAVDLGVTVTRSATMPIG